MRIDRVSMAAFASSLLLVAGSALVPVGRGSVDRAAGGPHEAAAAADVDRIRLHLGKVESALRARDVGGLSADRRARRATALDWLREYRLRGVFPHNHTHPGRRVPVFVDEHGTHCAVGYLLKRSGETELIEDVVAADNNVRVMELARSERLRSWLEETGLTLEEAAWIQPTYRPPADEKPDLTPTLYGGLASGGLALYSSLSRPGPRAFQVTGALSAALSLYHAGTAIHMARGELTGRTVGGMAMNGVLSVVSLHAAISRFLRSRDRRALLRLEAHEGETGGGSPVGRRLQVSLPEPALIHGRPGVRFRAVH